MEFNVKEPLFLKSKKKVSLSTCKPMFAIRATKLFHSNTLFLINVGPEENIKRNNTKSWSCYCSLFSSNNIIKFSILCFFRMFPQSDILSKPNLRTIIIRFKSWTPILIILHLFYLAMKNNWKDLEAYICCIFSIILICTATVHMLRSAKARGVHFVEPYARAWEYMTICWQFFFLTTLYVGSWVLRQKTKQRKEHHSYHR